MFIAARHVPWLRGPRRRETRTRLQGGFLINGQDDLIRRQGTCVEVDEFRDRGIKGRVPWSLGIEPEMMAPRLEVMAGQNPPHGGGGDTLNDPLRDELVCQFRAIPLGQAAAQRIRALAGQPHDVDRNLRGGNRPWHRGQGRP